jgi:4-nitrophenyl phosphatase
VSELLDSPISADAAAWLAGARGFILDMDGVLYRGATMIPEVPAFLGALEAAGIPYMMATNNSTQSPEDYARKLAGMGISVRPEQVATSGVAASDYVRGRYPRGTRAYVVGMQALRDAMFGDGYFVEAERGAELVVSGANFRLVYDDLKSACLCIRAGAEYVATNGDVTFPTEEGLIPGAGSIVAALVAATGVQPTIVGKPSPVMIQTCLDTMGITAAQAVVVGDRLDTDILSGVRAGARTVLVLTGVSTAEDVEATGSAPDLVVPTLAPLAEALAVHVAGR